MVSTMVLLSYDRPSDCGNIHFSNGTTVQPHSLLLDNFKGVPGASSVCWFSQFPTTGCPRTDPHAGPIAHNVVQYTLLWASCHDSELGILKSKKTAPDADFEHRLRGVKFDRLIRTSPK